MATLEMVIAHHAIGGVTESGVETITKSILKNCETAAQLVQELKRLRSRAGNTAPFQALADAVWKRLLKAIEQRRREVTEALDTALAIYNQ